MPVECKDTRGFLQKLMSGCRGEAQKRDVKILETRVAGKVITKFKFKTRKGGLHTLVVADQEKAAKLRKALPANVTAIDIKLLGKKKPSKE